MQVKMIRENENVDYDTRYPGASIILHYSGQSCSTGLLPTSLPPSPYPRSHTINLETMEVLGTCWGLDLSGGDIGNMRMELKIPPNSPISVSKVKVKDSKNPHRCFTARWRGSDNNKQEDVFVTGSDQGFYDDCW